MKPIKTKPHKNSGVTDFIRKCPTDWPTDKIMEEAKKAKIPIHNRKTIWNIQYLIRKANKKNGMADIERFDNKVMAGLPIIENKVLTIIPIQMLLWCPNCHSRHIDEGEFTSKAHHTHACQQCGMVWRPAIEPTCGVQFLPGFHPLRGG
jgi:predicted RNA-binding Zn-ribbon protein involved in translation (DUF1610 family)